MHPHTQKLLAGLMLLAAGASGTYWGLGRGPDFQVAFEREVVSEVPAAQLEKALHGIHNWADWHFNTNRVTALNLLGQEYALAHQTAMTGRLIRFEIEPPKKEWRRFMLHAVISDYFPGKVLAVRLTQDSTGRLEKLFSNLQWTIELEPRPEGGGTLIRGRLSGLTQSRRARILSRIAPRILMNQAFYPDLEKLARLEFPKDAVSR
jgi:hypothetical protein